MTMTDERRRKLIALGEFHDRWVDDNIADASVRFDPSAHEEFRDYNLHHVDLDADGAAQDEFGRQAMAILRGDADSVVAGSVRSLLAAFDRGGDPSAEDIAVWARAAGADTHPGGEELHRFWTKTPEGLAQWATLPEGRWTALFNHLKKHMPDEKARRVASAWFAEVIGYAPGSDKNRVASGKPPRGKKIGPG